MCAEIDLARQYANITIVNFCSFLVDFAGNLFLPDSASFVADISLNLAILGLLPFDMN